MVLQETVCDQSIFLLPQQIGSIIIDLQCHCNTSTACFCRHRNSFDPRKTAVTKRGICSMRVGVLASHQGSILQALIDGGKKHPDVFEVALVISNNRDAGALERARTLAIPHLHLSSHTSNNLEKLDGDICNALLAHQVDMVFLAGYLRKLGPKTLDAFANRILNTHPSLLPEYGGRGMYGNHVHAAVLAAGETLTGITIHLVNSEYDSGSIVHQCSLLIKPDDTVETLAARSAKRERKFVVETLLHVANGEITLPQSQSENQGS